MISLEPKRGKGISLEVEGECYCTRKEEKGSGMKERRDRGNQRCLHKNRICMKLVGSLR